MASYLPHPRRSTGERSRRYKARFWFPLPGHRSFLPVKPRKAATLTLLSASRRPISVGSVSDSDCVQAVHYPRPMVGHLDRPADFLALNLHAEDFRQVFERLMPVVRLHLDGDDLVAFLVDNARLFDLRDRTDAV